MTKERMILYVKDNLMAMGVTDQNMELFISDALTSAITYCNLGNDIPEEMEPYLRRKVKNMINYQSADRKGTPSNIASIKEGDGAITFFYDASNTEEAVFGLSDSDKKQLKAFRRLKGYA